jgi:hypothetical protein
MAAHARRIPLPHIALRVGLRFIFVLLTRSIEFMAQAVSYALTGKQNGRSCCTRKFAKRVAAEAVNRRMKTG